MCVYIGVSLALLLHQNKSMASRPGILTDWPWKPLGSFKVPTLTYSSTSSLYLSLSTQKSQGIKDICLCFKKFPIVLFIILLDLFLQLRTNFITHTSVCAYIKLKYIVYGQRHGIENLRVSTFSICSFYFDGSCIRIASAICVVNVIYSIKARITKTDQ